MFLISGLRGLQEHGGPRGDKAVRAASWPGPRTGSTSEQVPGGRRELRRLHHHRYSTLQSAFSRTDLMVNQAPGKNSFKMAKVLGKLNYDDLIYMYSTVHVIPTDNVKDTYFFKIVKIIKIGWDRQIYPGWKSKSAIFSIILGTNRKIILIKNDNFFIYKQENITVCNATSCTILNSIVFLSTCTFTYNVQVQNYIMYEIEREGKLLHEETLFRTFFMF